ncbi:MAG: hypothetical protein ACKVQU_01295 [Burkholderiales bacterium]
MVDPKWASVLGLALDAVGVAFLTYGLLISKKKAIELGSAYWSGETDEQNLETPPVRDRLRQSRNAAVGAILMVFGFALQIYGAWPR